MNEGIVKIVADYDKQLSWQVNIDGKEIQRIKSNLSYMSDDEKFATIITAAKTLSNCPAPSLRDGKKTGLAIGKVQSGKTSNFISLMALAFDNSYNIIIVFGGTKKNLLSQTESRIKKMFDIDNNKRDDRDVIILNSNDNFDSASPEQLNKWYTNGKKIIIIALKHPKHILGVRDYIKTSNLADKAILMIDDEGDQASLNTKTLQKQKSPIYGELIELKESLKHSAFISITATPQANLLIDTIDNLSPDFCQLVEPGKDYTGGSIFHGTQQDFYVKELPDDETEILDGDGVPQSFLEALSVFFVGSIVRKYRNEGKNHSMLIHPSQKKFNHSEVEKKVNLILEKWSTQAVLDYADPAYLDLKHYITIGYDELKNTVDNMPDLSIILKGLKEQLDDNRVLVINGDKNSDIDYYKTRNIIIIGGNLIERGLTIDDLAVTYIVRRSKNKSNADTVEQRARWFGYRKKYLDVCRVYCTQQIKQDFSNLLSHEDDLWSWVKYCQENNILVKQMPRVFELDDNLNPTRKNVIPGVIDVKFGYWASQQRIFNNINQINKINNAWASFLSNYEHEDIKIADTVHSIYQSIPLARVNKEIIAKYYNDIGFNWEYPCIVEQKLSKDGDEPVVDILIMRKDIGEGRQFDDHFKITSNLMQGHSTNRLETDPMYYPGDREIHNNRIQLQIHNVYPIKNEKIESILSEIKVPMLCFFAPVNGKIARNVGRSIE